MRTDQYPAALGCGENMVDALYLIQKMSLNGEKRIMKKLLVSHPRVTSRIEALEVRLGIQDGK